MIDVLVIQKPTADVYEATTFEHSARRVKDWKYAIGKLGENVVGVDERFWVRGVGEGQCGEREEEKGKGVEVEGKLRVRGWGRCMVDRSSIG